MNERTRRELVDEYDKRLRNSDTTLVQDRDWLMDAVENAVRAELTPDIESDCQKMELETAKMCAEHAVRAELTRPVTDEQCEKVYDSLMGACGSSVAGSKSHRVRTALSVAGIPSAVCLAAGKPKTDDLHYNGFNVSAILNVAKPKTQLNCDWKERAEKAESETTDCRVLTKTAIERAEIAETRLKEIEEPGRMGARYKLLEELAKPAGYNKFLSRPVELFIKDRIEQAEARLADRRTSENNRALAAEAALAKRDVLLSDARNRIAELERQISNEAKPQTDARASGDDRPVSIGALRKYVYGVNNFRETKPTWFDECFPPEQKDT